jgi:hypothetical protein
MDWSITRNQIVILFMMKSGESTILDINTYTLTDILEVRGEKIALAVGDM